MGMWFLSFVAASDTQNQPTKNMENTDTTNMKETKFPYYTGDCGLGLDPSDGHWDGYKFITPQGDEWHLPSDVPSDDLLDGNGIVWLFKTRPAVHGKHDSTPPGSIPS